MYRTGPVLLARESFLCRRPRNSRRAKEKADMSWFDAEQQVLNRHQEARRMADEVDLDGGAPRRPARFSLRQLAHGLGAWLVQLGLRLQGGERLALHLQPLQESSPTE
jgi:hypothetical protein